MSRIEDQFDALVEEAARRGASDLHIVPGQPVMIRVNGDLVDAGVDGIGPEFCRKLAAAISPGERFSSSPPSSFTSLDSSFTSRSGVRLRLHFYASGAGVSGAFRILPARIPTAMELGLPPEVACLSDRRRGLVLVVGSTGSGKSTTIACLIRDAARDRNLHVVTIEDPIEYLYEGEVPTGLVSQRQVGLHTPSYADGLRDALREDPDLIAVGELRDAESIELALLAAETGHVVYATAHAGGTAEAVDRLVHAVPAHHRDSVRSQLANAVGAVVYQELLPHIYGRGRVLAAEVLVATPAVRQVIREGRTHHLASILHTSRDAGMVSFETAVAALRATQQVAWDP